MLDDLVHARIESDDFPCDALQVFEVMGREAAGELFSFSIGVVFTGTEGLDLAAVEGATASIVFEAAGEEVRRVHGMIAQIDDLLDTEPNTRGYVLLLVPRAHRLTLVRTQEIFMDLSVREIITRKLDLVGLGAADVEMRLTGTYAAREFVVQYKETDLAFISRLAEHEGITFFFEHEGGSDKMVFSDDNGGFRAADGHATAFFQARGEQRDVHKIRARTQVVPRLHVVHDYNYRVPLVDPSGTAECASGQAGGLVEYGAHVKTPAEAAHIATLRAQRTEATHHVYTLEADLGWISAGRRFTLEGHPKLGDTTLIVTEIEHRLRQPVGLHGGQTVIAYGNTFRAIDASVPFRPPRVTAQPKIHGVINAVVAHEIEGTESLFGRLDADGRYLVRMMFDTSQAGDRQLVSRRIRMAQPHAGPNYGHHFPLKPGTEVLIAFIDGDPDRPIIMAAVPNPIASSPVAQNCAPAHRIKTATGILIEMKDA